MFPSLISLTGHNQQIGTGSSHIGFHLSSARQVERGSDSTSRKLSLFTDNMRQNFISPEIRGVIKLSSIWYTHSKSPTVFHLDLIFTQENKIP